MDFVIIFTCVLVIIAIVTSALLPALRRRRTGDSILTVTPGINERLINGALKALNCEGHWEDDGDDRIVKYTYQSGHFRMRLDKKSPYVRMSYLFFFDTETENINIVRNLCNQCNINTENARVVYSTNDEKNLVDVHVITGLMISEMSAKDVIARAMQGIFSWQNAFVKRYNEIVAGNRNSSNTDIEKAGADFARDLFLVREQELTHQTVRAARQSSTAPYSLERFLTAAFDISVKTPLKLTVMATDVSNLTDASEIMGYDLSSSVIADGKFIRRGATLNLTYTDERMPEKERLMSLNVKQEESTAQVLYYRVTATLVPLSVQGIIPRGSIENTPLTRSVLMAYDLTPQKLMLDEFRYIWKEAQEKMKRGDSEPLTSEQTLICWCADSQLAYHIYRGTALYLAKRFFEAVLYLENAYRVMQRSFDGMGSAEKDAFMELCYHLGSCYCGMEQYERAAFYLEIASTTSSIVYTEEYVNCLVNAHDFRAIQVIDTLMTQLNADAADEDGHKVAIDSFMNFLNRRKAYVLVENKDYGGATKILNGMLDDPENSDYAINELAYIQKILRKENEPEPDNAVQTTK
jgi:tetratricopeptide (TPR) repeat protein